MAGELPDQYLTLKIVHGFCEINMKWTTNDFNNGQNDLEQMDKMIWNKWTRNGLKQN